MKSVWTGTLGVLVTAPLALSAEPLGEPSITLSPVTVTDRSPIANPIESSITRTWLDREDIASSEERDLPGVIRGLPGVSLQSPGTRTTLNGLFIRGAAAGLGQVTYDDIPLYSSTANGFNLSAFPADTLETVDLVRGAVAPRYGSRALGGVLRLSSRDARRNGAFLHAEGGSYGILSETAGGSLRTDRYRGTITLSRDDQFDGPSMADRRNGNTEGDNFAQHQAVGRFSYTPIEALQLQGSFFYSRGRAEQDATGFLPDGRIGAVDDRQSFAINETWMAQTNASYAWSPKASSRLQLGFTKNFTRAASRGQPYGFDQRLLLARLTNTHELYATGEGMGSHRLSVGWGGELRQEEADNRLLFPGVPPHGARTTYTGQLEVQGQVGPWSGYLGTTVDHYDDGHGSPATLYTGLSHRLTEALQWRLSGGRGYRVPALQELLFVPAFANPTLKPEQSWSGDAGVDWMPEPGKRLSVTGFYHRYTDLIQAEFASLQPLLFFTNNVPNAQLWGFEVEGEAAWTANFKTGLNYTYTHSENLDNGRVLLRRPEQQGRVYLEWTLSPRPLTLWLEAVYRSGYFEDSALQIHEDAAARLNAQLSYRFSPRWQAYLRAENLADDRTPELFSFTTRGATVLAGLRFVL